MSKRSSIVHIEWRSRNVAKLKEFYKSAFRWKLDESMPGYLLANGGGEHLGVGMMQIEPGSSIQQGVVAFLESHDLGASESAIREAGGQVVGTPQEVPGWGRFSVFTDPDGNPVGLWQSEASVKKEEKKHKKAEKKRARAAEEAAPPEASTAAPVEDKAARKAEKRAHKLEKKAHKLAAKAEKRATGPLDPGIEKKKGKKADKTKAEKLREDADR